MGSSAPLLQAPAASTHITHSHSSNELTIVLLVALSNFPSVFTVLENFDLYLQTHKPVLQLHGWLHVLLTLAVSAEEVQPLE